MQDLRFTFFAGRISGIPEIKEYEKTGRLRYCVFQEADAEKIWRGSRIILCHDADEPADILKGNK
jgi:hypothetical protein